MDTRPSPRPILAILGTRFEDFEVERKVLGEVEIVSGPGRDQEQVLEVAAGADVILAGAGPRFDAATLEQLRCRGIVRLGVGVDTIDLDAAARLGIWVSYVPDYGTEAVALHTVTLALAAVRRLQQADRHIRTGGWGFANFRPLHLPSSLTVGVVGFGRIGRRVAEMLAGVGFNHFLVTDPQISDPAQLPPAVESVSLEAVLTESDLVTLHTPSVGAEPLIGASELASMKAGSALINTARGALIDTDALVAGLKAGRPATAALDVFEHEPPDTSVFDPVSEQVILTPHMAWHTEETELDLRRKGAAEARRILDGEEPQHWVVAPKAPTGAVRQ